MLEFKALKWSDVDLTSETSQALDREALQTLPAVQQALAQADRQLARYRQELETHYGKSCACAPMPWWPWGWSGWSGGTDGRRSRKSSSVKTPSAPRPGLVKPKLVELVKRLRFLLASYRKGVSVDLEVSPFCRSELWINPLQHAL